jgi:hypothetical protein
MPAKSRHGKGKRPQTRNRAAKPQTAGVNQAAATAPAASVPAPAKAVATKAVPAKSATKVVAYTPASTTEYPFFSSELKRITVITGVIVVILVVLAFIIR